MQELLGRLSALDPEATETLKVISYFDALVQGHASINVLLRGAAILGGCAVGFRDDAHDLRVDHEGRREMNTSDSSLWPRHALSDNGFVWMERHGAAHANDDMILERLALAVTIHLDRRSAAPGTALAINELIGPETSRDQRLSAAQKLGLNPTGLYRAIAAPRTTSFEGVSALVMTSIGLLRATIEPAEGETAAQRAGVGVLCLPDALEQSWRTALVALRLSTDREPVVVASELGAILALAEVPDETLAALPDFKALYAMHLDQPRALLVLQSWVEHESARAVAADLGVHHSTVQGRLADCSGRLGFDVRTASGRVRLALALAVHKLLNPPLDLESTARTCC